MSDVTNLQAPHHLSYRLGSVSLTISHTAIVLAERNVADFRVDSYFVISLF